MFEKQTLMYRGMWKNIPLPRGAMVFGPLDRKVSPELERFPEAVSVRCPLLCEVCPPGEHLVPNEKVVLRVGQVEHVGLRGHCELWPVFKRNFFKGKALPISLHIVFLLTTSSLRRKSLPWQKVLQLVKLCFRFLCILQLFLLSTSYKNVLFILEFQLIIRGYSKSYQR